MTNKMALAFAALALSSGLALAQNDPLSGAAERFFSTGPGRSAPARPNEYDGNKCDGAEGDARVWWGRFAGGRATFRGQGGGQKIQTFTSEGCFPSARACQAWMQALVNRYNAKPIYNQCRRGYEPGADVPPWWSSENG